MSGNEQSLPGSLMGLIARIAVTIGAGLSASGVDHGLRAQASATIGAVADWTHLSFGTGIGLSGLCVSSVAGEVEIIVGAGGIEFGGNRYWMILRYDSSTRNYDKVFSSPIYDPGSGPRSILVGELLATGSEREIAVCRANGTVEIWSEAERTLLEIFSTAATDPNAMALGDVDGDGATDLILISDDRLFAYDVQGRQKWVVAGVGGGDLVAAQMDSDPALEIATLEGDVVDSLSQQVQWHWRDGFGTDIEAADIDGDGLEELLFAAQSPRFLWAFDVDRRLPKWSIPLDNTGRIAVTDIDADGVQEVIVTDGASTGHAAFDSVTQELEWRLRNPLRGATGIAHGDVDGDGQTEILWGAGFNSSGPDYLYVADWSADTIEWQSLDVIGPFHGPLRGDIDGDGVPEIVTATTSSRSGFDGGVIFVFDEATLKLRAASQALDENISDLDLVDVDRDGVLEIVASAENLEIYDYNGGTTFTQIWKLPRSFNPRVFYRTSTIRDLNGDGRLEVVSGGEDFIFVYDYNTRAQLWRSFFLGPRLEKVDVGDPDHDGTLEILGLTNNGEIYIFDGPSRNAEAILFFKEAPYSTMHLIELSGQEVIVTGDTAGGISAHLFTGGGDFGYVEAGPVQISEDSIDGVHLVGGLVLIGSGGTLRAHVGLAPIWSSRFYGDGFGEKILVLPHLGGVMSAGLDGLAGFIPR